MRLVLLHVKWRTSHEVDISVFLAFCVLLMILVLSFVFGPVDVAGYVSSYYIVAFSNILALDNDSFHAYLTWIMTSAFCHLAF